MAQVVAIFPHMMTSSNGNIFRVTGPLCGEFTGYRWIPLTKASDAELWCFLWSASWINGWGWWFETLSRSLWRHCNDLSCIVNVMAAVDLLTRGTLNTSTINKVCWKIKAFIYCLYQNMDLSSAVYFKDVVLQSADQKCLTRSRENSHFAWRHRLHTRSIFLSFLQCIIIIFKRKCCRVDWLIVAGVVKLSHGQSSALPISMK